MYVVLFVGANESQTGGVNGMLMVIHKVAADDFTYGKVTRDWIVLEERSMCVVHPVALNSDCCILSGCLCTLCVRVCACTRMCVCVCVCHRLAHTASRNRKQGKV